MIYFGFFLLPLIQLGINWWIGIPLICLIIVLISLDFENISEANLFNFGILTWLIILSIGIKGSGDIRELLRAFRELLVFLFMLLALSPIEFKNRKLNPDRVVWILCIVSSLIFLLTFLQFLAISYGKTISLPESWYPRKLFTPSAQDLNSHTSGPLGLSQSQAILECLHFLY